MSKPLKLTIGIGLSLLVLIAAIVLFLHHLLTKSFPVVEGDLSIIGLRNETSISRDELGVPHILANNEYDLFFTQGYVHAQDRLWQMDMIRRVAQGRLSEILGDVTIEYDKLFRTLGIAELAETVTQSLHPESQQLLAAYADGVNAFLHDNEHRLPVEFDVLNYRPEPWQPSHSIMAGRMVAWDLAMATMTDIPFAMLADRVGIERSAEVLPTTYGNRVTVLAALRALKAAFAGHLSTETGPGIAGNVRWGTWFMPTNYNLRTSADKKGMSGGSNSWVIGANRSATGKPILANDIHLVMPVPSLWYQMHLHCPGLNVAGVSLPGVPLIVVGRNTAVAWGFTNAMVDDLDFFVEQIDTSLETYLYQGRGMPLHAREEKIYVGKKDSVIITRRSTHHGPIVDEIHGSVNAQYRYMLAMKWTGFAISDEFRALYLMNKASTPAEFEAGVRLFTVPGQNVLYADTLGNIAHWVAARIPIRKHYNPMLPLPGWTGDAEWKEYIPFTQLPKIVNPPEGLLASANNPFVGPNYPYYISELWEPPSRIARIRELLNTAEILTGDDVKRFQIDILSPHGREFAAHLLDAFQKTPTEDSLITAAVVYVRNWDFRFHRDYVAPTIVNATFLKFLKNVLEDELGDTVFRYLITFTAIPYRISDQLLAAEYSDWYDDVRTPERETKDEILRKSLYDALRELRQTLGTDTRLWQWGSVHTVTFTHPFGTRKPLDNVFNIGPFPLNGSGSTVNKAEFRFADPYAVVAGPSARHVIDLSNRETFSTVITSGASGQVLHPHYDDQTILWLNGTYHTMTIDPRSVQLAGWQHLTLKPE